MNQDVPGAGNLCAAGGVGDANECNKNLSSSEKLKKKDQRLILLERIFLLPEPKKPSYT